MLDDDLKLIRYEEECTRQVLERSKKEDDEALRYCFIELINKSFTKEEIEDLDDILGCGFLSDFLKEENENV